MIERHHQAEDVSSRALYSPCERYRYGLERVWGDGPMLLYIMLNPSTADELRNDPTIERCQRRAGQLGFGAMRIANLFAWRATRPEDLRRAEAPVGPENDALLQTWQGEADMTLAAWGVHGAHLGRGPEMAAALGGALHHLGLTRDGHPRHPLYVSYKVQPEPWPAAARYAETAAAFSGG
ncbi:DUF1643 domain-containing protein [Salipiger sp. P9]|uniref:DUF1643 domain-containing protein n=1 Tax=Salipiger pentaromativorans TaxID=2943193 RepID=UPI0021572B52|nr:DUF1643 domain-containing protein [Salipiger pentaromativorans]MCR8548017.1 DUF1643 domain-containing protein [Salipiger pentaromativorans]